MIGNRQKISLQKFVTKTADYANCSPAIRRWYPDFSKITLGALPRIGLKIARISGLCSVQCLSR